MRFLQALLGVAVLVVLGRAFVVQIKQHGAWQELANERNVLTQAVPPTRGTIRDRSGTPLAASFEAYHLSIAQNEIPDSIDIQELLVDSLGLPARLVKNRFNQPYPYFGGPFDANEALSIRRIHGVSLQRIVEREGRLGALARPFVGRFNDALGNGTSGIEASFDSLLRGKAGSEQVLLDAGGRRVQIPGGVTLQPVAGHDVYLTIDHQLQGITEASLAEAVKRFDARGGDAVVVNVRTGEVLAISSLRTLPPKPGEPLPSPNPVPVPAAIVEPYEPGSTAKIFTAAALLENQIDLEPVPGHDGVWKMEVAPGITRTIRDTHKEAGFLTLAETIKFSSNIAISQFALRLEPDQQYRMLRAFGFGTRPGLGFPSEASGLLVPPAYKANLKYTMPSWAQGYEFSTSSLQLAMAYSAIANGGMLMAPTLVREIHASNSSRVTWMHHPDTLRRVISKATADSLMSFLALVTESGGTGTGAQLDLNGVIGKTGTAKLDGSAGEGYQNRYRGSFAAIFPADDPEFVVFVMIDQPGGDEYYGGEVAAPVVKTILQQAMAMPSSPLESARLSPVITLAHGALPDIETPTTSKVPFPLRDSPVHENTLVAVPDLNGWAARDAAFMLTRLGFQVRLRGNGTINRTAPVAGDSLAAGSTVTLFANRTTQ